jgi:hypothetical protein
MPGVVVHRHRKPIPYVPRLSVVQGVTVDELIRDEDDDAEPHRGDS